MDKDKAENILELVGKTPMVKLNRLADPDAADIYAKLESFNPGGSIKDRICLSMIADAEKRGLLRPGGTIIEPTSGNTGVGLAMVAAVKGYKLILTMPDAMSMERVFILESYGAEIVLTPGEEGMLGAIQKAKELSMHIPGSFMPQQFNNPANPPIVAASGFEQPSPQTGPASNLHHYALERGRAFALSASYEYLVSEQDAGGVLVKSYYFPEHQAAGQAVLQASAQAIQILSKKFGPPPHATLSAVEADFDDGMEFSGLYFLGREYYEGYDGTPMNYATLLAAHETGHQWWFERVANDQAREPWLDEALTTYSELVFLESAYPELVSWWWPFRVDGYEPQGWVDTSIYGGGKFRPYVNAVYLRGAHFMHDLRVRMGDESFFAFMRDYLARMDGGVATKENFLTILREHTSSDVSDIIAAYFQDTR